MFITFVFQAEEVDQAYENFIIPIQCYNILKDQASAIYRNIGKPSQYHLDCFTFIETMVNSEFVHFIEFKNVAFGEFDVKPSNSLCLTRQQFRHFFHRLDTIESFLPELSLLTVLN